MFKIYPTKSLIKLLPETSKIFNAIMAEASQKSCKKIDRIFKTFKERIDSYLTRFPKWKSFTVAMEKLGKSLENIFTAFNTARKEQ